MTQIDNQQAVVLSLCERYLENDKSVVSLLNTLIIYAADMALIDEKREEKEFDYLDGLEELIHAMKNMNHDMGRYNLLSMGDYARKSSAD